MNRSLRDNILFGCVLILLVLIVTDCSSGHKRFCPGVVHQHVYRPAYTTTRVVTDNKGYSRTDYDYHPEEYRLLVECEQPSHVANIEINATYYALIRDEQPVLVGERIGRWSNMLYFSWIENIHQPTGSDTY